MTDISLPVKARDSGPARPWVVLATCPLRAMALGLLADRVHLVNRRRSPAVTVAVFNPTLRSLCVLAEFLGASRAYPARRDAEAARLDWSVYFADEPAEATPWSKVLEALSIAEGGPR